MHEHHAALGGELVDELLAILAVAVVLDHLGAVALGGGALERRGVVGHEDHRSLPHRRAASATAWAWLPEETAHTPRSSSSGDSEETAL